MKPIMKPFDIDKAIAGEPVFTRSGKDATYVGKIKDYVSHPYVFFVDGSILICCDKDGTTSVTSSWDDLFMKVEQTYKVGDVLLVDYGTRSCYAVICRTGPEKIQLIALDSGNRFTDKTTEINHMKDIKDTDIKKLFDSEEYTYEFVGKGAFRYEP